MLDLLQTYMIPKLNISSNFATVMIIWEFT